MADSNNNMKEFFINYNYLIFSFEKFIERLYQNKEENSNNLIHGYLVNFKEYEDLKENLNYNKVKSFYSSQNIDKEKIIQHCDIHKLIKIKNFKFHPIEFNTPRYLIYRLNNKDNFIIINEQIWNILGAKDEISKNYIEYKIEENNQISINFGNGDNILVKSDNNIINEYSIKYCNKVEEYKYYIDEYKNIIKDINSFYNIENEFLDNINKKEKSNVPKSGYLISFSWINNWKKITNYEKIKFLIKFNSNNSNSNLNNISDEVIYHLEKNNFKYNDLPPLEIHSFKTKKDLDDYLMNDSLVIVDSNFIRSFKNKSEEIITIYNLNKNEIQFNSSKDMIYEIYKNIIIAKEQLNIFFLKKLFRIIKFNPNEQNNYNLFLLNGQILEDMKSILNYNRVNKALGDNNISYNNNFEEYFSEIIKIIKNNGEYKDKMEKINFLDSLKNINNNYILSGKHDDLKISNKIISFDYPDNFIIADEEILLFLSEINIINISQKAQYCRANYIFKDGKILLILKEKDDRYLYIIGQFSPDGSFINEYIIKEENNKQGTIQNFCNKYKIDSLIDNFLKEENKNEIKNKEELIGYFIKIKKNEIKENENQIIINNSINNNNINEESLKKENEDFIIKIISLVSSLHSFEKEINNNLYDSLNNNTLLKSINNSQSYYLIKSEFIFQLKTLCEYSQIEQYWAKTNNNNNPDLNEILNNKDYINSILSNKSAISSLFIIENYKIKITNIESYIYPDDFYILNSDLCLKLRELNNNIDNIKKYEINMGFNCGKIILKINNSLNNNYYICIYSLKQDFSEIINYKIHSLLAYSNINDLNNHFLKLINEENLSDYFGKINQNKNDIKYILIDKKDINENNAIENEDYLILYNIILYSEYSMLEQLNQKLFLINRDLMQELESNLYFNEIKQLLLNNNQSNNFAIHNKDKEEKKMIIKAIKLLMNENLIQEFKKINMENIGKKLNNYQILNLQNKFYENQNIFYFNNCQVITENICSLIKKIVPNIIIEKECFIINKKKIFSQLNKETICIGDLSQNNIFKANYVIYSKDISYIQNLMNNLVVSGIKSIKIDSFPPHVQIILIESNETNNINININNNENIIINNDFNKRINFSNKLSSLIYLAFFSQKKLLAQNTNNIRVILLNKKWLYQFHYDKIVYLINQANIQLNPTNIDDIINKLDKNTLTKIDQNLPNNISLDESILADPERYQLKNKQIKVYKEFILVKFDDFLRFIKNFTGNEKLNFDNKEQIGYINKQNEDIIFIAKNEQEKYNYLFIGKIDDVNNTYNIKFILDYDKFKIFKEQKNILLDSDLNSFFNDNIIFKQDDNNDLLSPIIYNNAIVGSCFKFFDNINNYINCPDYTELIKNKIFQNTLKLYYNYNKIFSKLKSNNSNLEKQEYFLVNRAFISQIKQELNFMELCSYLFKDGVFNKYPIDIFNTIKLFKNTDMNSLKNFFMKNINSFENYYSLLEIGIIPVKYYDSNNEKCVMIYNDFELIEREIIELFVDIDRIENYLVKCIINEGKIMILFSKNFDQEKRGISVIGKLSNELNFVTEYILVYDNVGIRMNHTKYIYGNLTKFISDFQFVNHCQPIHDKDFNIVGTVIDYAQYDNSKNFNTPVNVQIFNTIPNHQSPITNPNNFFPPNNNIINQNIIHPMKSTNNDKTIKTQDDIRTTFIYPTLIGLQNIGATCYMNATLQCLCHIDKFVNFFKYNKQANFIYNNKDENKLSYSFKILIEQLWPDGQNNKSKKYYAPHDFKEKISKMNPLFEGIQANDSKDLVNFIVMTLHEELNKANSTNNNLTDSINIDQRNKDLVFSVFIKNFTETNQSIISDIFYGVHCSITQCQNCKTISYNYQTYFFLIFPLEEVRKFKMQYNPNDTQLLNIYDCFQYNQKIDLMFGENAMYCNYCRQTCGATMGQILTVTPEVLILILNRGQGIQFKIKLNFFEDLNLANFVEHKETGCRYKLIGVITHLGESDMSGHFIAYCKDPISNVWYKFNDAIVNQVQDFQNEVINFAMPYLLFYQKIQQ